MHYQTLVCVMKSLPGVPGRPLGPPRPLSPSKPGGPGKPAKTQESEYSSLLCYLVSSGNTKNTNISLPHLWLQDPQDPQADQESHLILFFLDSRTGPSARGNQGSLRKEQGKYIYTNLTLFVVLKETQKLVM